MAEETPGIASGFLGMFNVFVDPAGLAKACKAKLFWLWPLIVFLVVFIVIGVLLLPYTMQLMDAKLAERGGPPERVENARNMMHKFAPVGVPITPIIIILIILLCAWLVSVVGSIMGMRAKFRDVFSISMACSLIGCLQYIAGYIVIRTKGDEIVSQEQLSPAFGLDIFVPAHGALLAVLNYFSIFQIWSLVIFALALAALTGASKGKAFAAITPAWVIPLIIRVISAAVSGGSSSQ